MQKNRSEELINLEQDEVLFYEGDWSGVLYQILAGTVEVYKKDKHDSEVVLNTMGPGEIIGLTSFLTSSSRLASVRAKTKVSLKKIESKKLEFLKTTTPKWMETIIKDMLLRLEQMNTHYLNYFSESQGEKIVRQVPILLAAAQVTSIGKFIEDDLTVGLDGEPHTSLHNLKENINSVFCLPRPIVSEIIDYLVEDGLLSPFCSLDHSEEEMVSIKNVRELSYLSHMIKLLANNSTRQSKFQFMSKIVVKFLEMLISKQGNKEPAEVKKSITYENLYDYFEKEFTVEVFTKILSTLSQQSILKVKIVNETKFIEYSEAQLKRYIQYYFLVLKLLKAEMRLAQDEKPKIKNAS